MLVCEERRRMDSRLAYVMADSHAHDLRRQAEQHAAHRRPADRRRARRAPRIPLVLMFLRATRG
jgi:hypothetical protein